MGTARGRESQNDETEDKPNCLGRPQSCDDKPPEDLGAWIAAIETSVGKAADGLSHILSELRSLKKHIAVHAGGTPSANIPAMPVSRGVADNCVGPDHKSCGPLEHVGDDNVGTTSHSNFRIPSLPHSNVHRGASFSDPLEVDDSESTDSLDSKGAAEQHCSPAPIQHTPARRVHLNPRLRVSPLSARLAVARPPTVKGGAESDPTGEQPPKERRYKDPSRNKDIADFGHTSKPQYTGPVLKPRKNSVSLCYPSCKFDIQHCHF